MQSEKLRKLSIQIMIASLIGAAVIAVTAVLAGSFNQTFGKALLTLGLVMFHSLASLAFIDRSNNKDRSFEFFENCVFSIIVLSFFTSVLGTWAIISGDIVSKLYGTYGILLFASLHGQMLTETRGKQKNIDGIVLANYVMMTVVVALILPLIWLGSTDFPNVYARILAAFGIIDATLTILAVILHRMYIQKHPKIESTIFTVQTALDANGQPVAVKAEEPKRHTNPLVWILGIFLGAQLFLSIVVEIVGRLSK